MQKTTMIVALAVVATMAMPTDASAPTEISKTDLYEKNYDVLIAPFEEMVEGTPIDLDEVTATVRTEAGYATMSVRDAVRGHGAFFAARDIDVEVLNMQTAAEQGSWPVVAGPIGRAVDSASSHAMARESAAFADDHSADTTASCADNVDETYVAANPLAPTVGRGSIGGFAHSITHGTISTTGIVGSYGNNGLASSVNPLTQAIDDYVAYGGGIYSGGEPTTVLGGPTFHFYCYEVAIHQPTHCYLDSWYGWVCWPGMASDSVWISSTMKLSGYINDEHGVAEAI